MDDGCSEEAYDLVDAPCRWANGGKSGDPQQVVTVVGQDSTLRFGTQGALCHALIP